MIDTEVLQRAITERDSATFLVPFSVIHRVQRAKYGVGSLMVGGPHDRSLLVDRETLRRHVEPDEMGLAPNHTLPGTVTLLAAPTDERTGSGDRETILLRYWRMLFHCGIDREMHRRREEGKLGPEAIKARIDRIGRTVFEEVRSVLEQENLLLPPADEASVYAEFAAVYMELKYFRSNLLGSFFPGIRDHSAIGALLSKDVNADELFAQTRLRGSPNPTLRADRSSDESTDDYRALLRAAAAARRDGDLVRAAIVHQRSSRIAPAATEREARQLAHEDLEGLTRRLAVALELDPAESADWLDVLPALLEKSDHGTWPPEAKMLRDLQNVCVEYEREVYAVDPVVWVMTAGRRPIRRALLGLKVVRMVLHLRSANERLTSARMTDEDRTRLGQLFRTATRRGEDRLRDRFRPTIRNAIIDVGLSPENPPEQVALDKVIEELLDRIWENGFFTFSDLRDALSANQLKLGDVTDPHAFWWGDPLLMLDRRLATDLEGVYRRGEVHLRWMESTGSMMFGTKLGRFISEHVVAPFGGAAALLFAGPHLYHTVVGGLGRLADAVTSRLLPAGAEEPVETVIPETPHIAWWAYPALGIFLWLLMHRPGFRHLLGDSIKTVWNALWSVCFDFPLWIWRHAWVQRLARSWPWLLMNWYIARPAAVCVVIWYFAPEAMTQWPIALGVFLAATVLLNSAGFGVAMAGFTADVLLRVFRKLRYEVLVNLLRRLNHFFKQLADAVESLLYWIDERLRFRSGESRVDMVLRAVGNSVWFPVRYVVRLYFVTLIEPSINPLKLPVGIMAAKFFVLIPNYVLLMAPYSSAQLEVMAWLEQYTHRVFAEVFVFAFLVPTLWLAPSAVAFLLWEMNGNRKLFAANRPAELRRQSIGRSGETMLQMVKTRHHGSGTLAKLFARLRRAERLAYRTNSWREARSIRKELDDAGRRVQVFVERELLALLRRSRSWPSPPLRVGELQLSCNRILIRMDHADHPDAPAWLAFEEVADGVGAGFRVAGWTQTLPDEARAVLVSGLVGLYKYAGAELVLRPAEPPLHGESEPIRAIPVTAVHAILARAAGDKPVTASRPLEPAAAASAPAHGAPDPEPTASPAEAGETGVDQPAAVAPATITSETIASPATASAPNESGANEVGALEAGPPPGASGLREAPPDSGPHPFGRMVLTWDHWVECWRRDAKGEGHKALFAEEVVLPRAGSARLPLARSRT